MSTPRLTRAVWLLPVALAAVAAGLWLARPGELSPDEILREARRQRTAGDPDAALASLQPILDRNPPHAPALLLAADIAKAQNRPRDAVAFYLRLPDDSPRLASTFADAGGLALSLGRAGDAETLLRRGARLDPHAVEVHRRLAEIFVAEGRRWESAPHLWETVRLRRFSLRDLALLGNLDELVDVSDTLRTWLKAVPEDPVPLTGLARLALHRRRYDEAKEMLRRVFAASPGQIEAQATLGRLLAEQGDETGFRKWQKELPAPAEAHPDVWAARGLFAERTGDTPGAIRCYLEAARRDPNHRTANVRLAHLLVVTGMSDAAEPFAERARRLDAYVNLLRPVLREETDPETFRAAARLTEELGRPWEAWAWCYAATHHHPGETWAAAEAARLERELGPAVPRTLASANPASTIDLARFPMPTWKPRNPGPGTEWNDGETPALTGIRFADAAAEAGLTFSYDNGASSPEDLRIYQGVGGGVAAIDYDHDGWPDLYFPQAGPWPISPGRPCPNRIWRNSGTGTFADVTEQSGAGDPGFGLGAAAGDFDEDGFQDLFTANIGRSRLYRNNGDGTFADVTDSAGLSGERWTSCGLIADLNGDAVPDLYEVNYCAGREPFERVCPNPKVGGNRTCRPTLFPADPDRIYLGRGDGTFEDATDRSGVADTDGRGLGIVAFDSTGSGRLDLFVANDMTANFFWANRTSGPGAPPQFEERALPAGLAFDADGQPQASMGIAADDADGNGLTDLFVTNFYNESNALYLQTAPGVFVDSARDAGLREPSLKMLGFGTQFLDADLDGRPDLVVANGHIDDYTKIDTPFRMRPQFFRNEGGIFRELPAAEVGPYFTGERLGRGLARLDWDRDGRDDFAVSHLFGPAALLTNRSPRAGRGLALRLSATSTSRDAIGTTVQVTAGGRSWTKQLTAGDGYQCSNERRLLFGLGDALEADGVEIRWPGGRRQRHGRLAAGSEYLAVEGHERPTLLSPPPTRETATIPMTSWSGSGEHRCLVGSSGLFSNRRLLIFR